MGKQERETLHRSNLISSREISASKSTATRNVLRKISARLSSVIFPIISRSSNSSPATSERVYRRSLTSSRSQRLNVQTKANRNIILRERSCRQRVVYVLTELSNQNDKRGEERRKFERRNLAETSKKIDVYTCFELT